MAGAPLIRRPTVPIPPFLLVFRRRLRLGCSRLRPKTGETPLKLPRSFRGLPRRVLSKADNARATRLVDAAARFRSADAIPMGSGLPLVRQAACASSVLTRPAVRVLELQWARLISQFAPIGRPACAGATLLDVLRSFYSALSVEPARTSYLKVCTNSNCSNPRHSSKAAQEATKTSLFRYPELRTGRPSRGGSAAVSSCATSRASAVQANRC